MSDYYTDPVPAIDPKLIEAAILIGTNGHQAYYNTLFGSRTPDQKAYYDRARVPRVGDLVLERSSFGLRFARNDHPEICLGTLIEGSKSEWIPYELSEEDKKDLAPDELGYRENAWYIKVWVMPDDASPLRWTNCDFIAMPRNLTEARKWEGR